MIEPQQRVPHGDQWPTSFAAKMCGLPVDEFEKRTRHMQIVNLTDEHGERMYVADEVKAWRLKHLGR